MRRESRAGIDLALDSLYVFRTSTERPGGNRKMVNLLESEMPRTTIPSGPAPALRSVRPSLMDLRFTGDPWVVDHEDGTASVRLDDYRLARLQTVPYDLPSLNQLLLQLRQWQTRRRFYRQLRARCRPDLVPQPASEASLQPIQ